MASILTNASALTALQSLNATNKQLEMTQARISTGYRVSKAADNAAYWSIATTMRSDNNAMSTVQDALGLGARQDRHRLHGDEQDDRYRQRHQGQGGCRDGAAPIRQGQDPDGNHRPPGAAEELRRPATFSGANWLSVDTTTGHAVAGVHDTTKIVSSFNRDSAGNVTLGTIDINVQGIKLYDGLRHDDQRAQGHHRRSASAPRGVRDNTAIAAVGGTVAARMATQSRR